MYIPTFVVVVCWLVSIDGQLLDQLLSWPLVSVEAVTIHGLLDLKAPEKAELLLPILSEKECLTCKRISLPI